MKKDHSRKLRWVHSAFFETFADAVALDQLTSFLDRNEFQEVLLLADESKGRGLLPREILLKRLRRMTEAVATLKQKGFTVGVWLGTVLGHGIERIPHSFRKMVNIYGETTPTAVCPLDEDYLDYIRLYIETAAGTGAESILLDDDFRYAGHGDGQSLMDEFFCFCDQHISRFNERYRSAVTREGLLEIFNNSFPLGDEDDRIKKNWFLFLQETMEELACCIGRVAKGVNPEMQVGLCLCGIVAAQLSGRDTRKLLLALAQGGRPCARPGRGGYEDVDRLTDMDISGFLFQTGVLPPKTRILSETSIWPGSRFAKSPRTWMRQVAMDVFLGVRELFIFDDGFLTEDTRYTEEMKQVRPVLEELSRRVDKDAELRGVGVVMAEEAALYPGDAETVLQAPFNAYVVLSRLGIPARAVDVRNIENEAGPFLLTGNIPLLIPEHLRDTVLERGVLVDATALRALSGSGWKEFEAICSGEPLVDVACEAFEGHPLNGSAGGGSHDWQASPATPFYRLNLSREWEVVSSLKDGLGNLAGPCFAVNEDKNRRTGIWAYALQPDGWHLSFPKKEQLDNAVAWLAGDSLPVRLNGSADIQAICRAGDNQLAVGLFNFSSDFSHGVSLQVSPEYSGHSVCVMNGDDKEPSFREVTPLREADYDVIELEESLALSPSGWEVFVFSPATP